MKKLKLTLLVASLFIVGCKTQKPIYITEYQTKTIKEVVKDTVIDIQIKEMYIENKTKDTLSELSTNNAFSRALWSNGILFHSLEQKGVQPTKIAYKDRIIVDSIYKSVLEIKEVEKKLNWWQKTLILIGKIGLIGIGFIIIYFVIRR